MEFDPTSSRYKFNKSVSGREKIHGFHFEPIHIHDHIRKTETGCWEWLGCKNDRGYGMIGRKLDRCGNVLEGQLRVHRLSLELKLGRFIAKGLFAIHSCDNPPCINPEHLREGTLQENSLDCFLKGRKARGERSGPHIHRSTMPRGSANAMAKLNEQQVATILSLLANGVGRRQLESDFKISYSTIALIEKRKIWKHVSLPVNALERLAV
jgi:hypothetical protein